MRKAFPLWGNPSQPRGDVLIACLGYPGCRGREILPGDRWALDLLTQAAQTERIRFGGITQTASWAQRLPGSSDAHPVIAGKRIFVRDEDAVTMWTME
jgi:hypothetical protein